jgi:hypothetical protein
LSAITADRPFSAEDVCCFGHMTYSLTHAEWKSASLGGTYAVIPSESLYYDNSNHFSSPFTVTTTA